MKYIGQSVARVDAMSKVKGEAVFASDMIRPGQAYMKMLMSHRPHAIVKPVDTSKAEALPGVLTVFTSQDVPCNEFGYYTYDQPVLCGPSEKPFADRVRFVGDRVAAVVAETEAAAAKARDLIEVEYEDLPAVCDVEEAMQPGAPIAFYLSILVTVTFYIRSQISMNSFRTIHYLSIIAYLGALLHGLLPAQTPF